MTDHVEYTTDDMTLAAYLMHEGAEFLGLVPLGGRMYQFKLKCPSRLANAPHVFGSAQAKVEPMRYATHLKKLKGEIARRRNADLGPRP